MAALKILVVDDHDVVRRGLRVLLETHAGWKVCGEAATGGEAIRKAQKLEPDIVVLDIGIPEPNGLEVARRLRKAGLKAQILVLTIHESEELVSALLKAGARGFMLKSDAGRELITAIEALNQHKPYFTSKVARMVLDGYLSRSQATAVGPSAPVRLSTREREIIQLLAEGRTNKEMASRLNISIKTVETHRSNIMHKLNLHSMSELTRYAVRNNIIEP
ncbi:MAG TPA: response regulator transcription factor [Terriglobia bacterium]|nr:response regulator transcription factor [Terriglobia bacterium]